MKTGLKILNWLVIFGVLFSALSVASEGQSIAEAVGGFVGASFWLLLPVLTLKALKSHPSIAVVRGAYAMNGLAVAVFTAVGVGLSASSGSAVYLPVYAICLAPFLFNIWGVRKLTRTAPIHLELVEDSPPSDATPGVDHAQAAASPGQAPSRPVSLLPEPGTAFSSNYVVRHWQGELSLPVSYWVNGSLVGIVLALIYALLGVLMEDSSVRSAASVSIVILVSLVATTLWSLVGIWRSAVNHPSRGGSVVWATTAKVMVVLGFISLASSLSTTLLPQLKEFALIATGHDPMGRVDAKISTNGTALILRGRIGAGSAQHVEQLLAAAPGVRTVMLDSAGGRLKEAAHIASFVKARKLNTYVETHCESACTYVFLAGLDRAATPNAKIGFHSPTFVGFDEAQKYDAILGMQAVYRASGIPQAFLDRVAATEPESMWYPSRDELIEAGVINRVSLGGEVASITTSVYRSKQELALAYRELPLILAIDQHFPGTIDQAVEAAWQAHRSGANDSDLNAAARRVLTDNYPRLLAAATGEQLKAFLVLSIDQLRTAQALSDEACGLLINSRLDVSNVFPAELVNREMQWMSAVLNGDLIPQPPVAPKELEQILETVVKRLPDEHIQVIADLQSYADDPKLQCEASIRFYETLMQLPERDRDLALRGIFHAANETG